MICVNKQCSGGVSRCMHATRRIVQLQPCKIWGRPIMAGFSVLAILQTARNCTVGYFLKLCLYSYPAGFLSSLFIYLSSSVCRLVVVVNLFHSPDKRRCSSALQGSFTLLYRPFVWCSHYFYIYNRLPTGRMDSLHTIQYSGNNCPRLLKTESYYYDSNNLEY